MEYREFIQFPTPPGNGGYTLRIRAFDMLTQLPARMSLYVLWSNEDLSEL
jgi:hypothetical protein